MRYDAESRRISRRIYRRLHDVIAERVDHKLRRVTHNLANQLIPLLRVGVIEAALEDTAPVPSEEAGARNEGEVIAPRMREAASRRLSRRDRGEIVTRGGGWR